MLEKLVIAVTITFCLNLFLGVHFINANKPTSSYHLVKTQNALIRLLLTHGFRRKLLLPSYGG
jgi:hypothetical protein